jgi:cell division septation protein DedD
MTTVQAQTPASSSMRSARTLIAVGVAAAVLSGCSIWPKALTWGSGKNETPPPENPSLTLPPTLPVLAEEPAKPSVAPVAVASSTTESAALEPQVAARPIPVMAPPEPPAAEKMPAKAAVKGKGKGADKAMPAKSGGSALVPGFYINVGLFAVPSNGTNAFRTLEKAELPVFTDVVKRKKGPLTRVRVGPYLSKAQADAAAEKIKGMKLEAVVFQH